MRTLPPTSAALLGAVLLSAAGAGAGARAEPPVLSQGRNFDEQGGAALWAGVCAACHQPDARGAAGAAAYPSLAGNADLASADFVESLMLQGLRGMPPLGLMMSDAQVADVVGYVRTHFGNSYGDPVTEADVAAARK